MWSIALCSVCLESEFIKFIMNKSTYLELPEVKDFVEWLSVTLNSDAPEPFSHSYDVEPRGRSNSKKKWRCNSIYNAFEQYEWRFSYQDSDTGKKIKGSTYSESEAALNDLQKRLIFAVASGDNDSCFNVCSMILKWGGVLGSEKKGNKKILLEMRDNLACYLAKARDYFNGDSELVSRYQVVLGSGKTNLVMNAGFTKIYSLLCNEFIIYDGRVGAALGRLVVGFMQSQSEKKYTEIPDGLDFYYGNAKNNKVNRNPSVGSYKFKGLSASSPVHIRNNLKANWIVGALSLENSNGFSKQSAPTRAFEAALFMIGYRV